MKKAGKITNRTAPLSMSARGPGRDDEARQHEREGVLGTEAEADQPVGPVALHPGHRQRQHLGDRRGALEAHVGVERQNEAQGPGDVGHRAQEPLALDQRLADEPDLEELEGAQAPMEELGGGRGDALARSPFSGQAHPDASRAIPQPFTSPPMRRRSNWAPLSRPATLPSAQAREGGWPRGRGS